MFFNLFNTAASKPTPEYWKTYLQRFRYPLSSKTPLSEVRFVILDTETTGLNVEKDKVISIGAVSVSAKQVNIDDALEYYLPSEIVNVESIKIHGILPNGRQERMDAETAVRGLLDYCKDSIIVGHHIGFDIKMLNKLIKPIVGDTLRNRTIDTASLGIRLEQYNSYSYPVNPHQFSLDALCRRYNIDMHDRHTAAGDAFITALLFLKLMNRLNQKGVTTLGGLV
jgi:DNA polymerase-3 subunit epsilon